MAYDARDEQVKDSGQKAVRPLTEASQILQEQTSSYKKELGERQAQPYPTSPGNPAQRPRKR